MRRLSMGKPRAARSALPLYIYMTHWPHAPPHLLSSQGLFIVTAGTYLKIPIFQTPDQRDFLQTNLLSHAKISGWQLHAWAIFSNHYHFVARSPENPKNLSTWIAQIHQLTSAHMNKIDGTPTRKVWYQFWETRITSDSSYLARLNYLHQNPVKHRLVPVAAQYPWCSAADFEREAKPSLVKSVYSFDFSKVKVFDDF